jgi:Protein of unknown function (DUF2815)
VGATAAVALAFLRKAAYNCCTGPRNRAELARLKTPITGRYKGGHGIRTRTAGTHGWGLPKMLLVSFLGSRYIDEGQLPAPPSRQQTELENSMAEKKERKSLQSPVGIATFVHLWKPFAFKATSNRAARDPQYSVLLVFDKAAVKSPEMRALKLACIEAAEAKFGVDKTRDRIKSGKIAMPWRDATEYEEYGEPFTEDGSLMITFKSNTAPGIVSRRATPITDEREIYPGCKMRVSFGVWPYDTDGSKGVTLLLNNVQKAGDGPRLAGRADAEEEFESIDGDDDSDPGDDDDI